MRKISGVNRNKWGQILCHHNRIKSGCRLCGSRRYCQHGRVRTRCEECGGTKQIPTRCEHDKIKQYCKPCNGSGICAHDISRASCRECSPLGAYKVYIKNAKKRDMEFTLSFDEYFIISRLPCRYCGHQGPNGIDRVNNEQGYTKENSGPCCTICNRMKLNYTPKQFLQHITSVVSYSLGVGGLL